MIDFTEIRLEELALHIVGNKAREEGYKAAKNLFQFESEEQRFLLMDYFLGSFNMDEINRFTHDTSLDMNEMYMYCKYIFEDPEQLYSQSLNILQHLYNASGHPNVKGGEVYVTFFKDCLVDDELVDAVGIFKSEKKDTYLKLKTEEEIFRLEFEVGTNMHKLDKGCLIINAYPEDGYRVLCVDLKSTDARFWKEEFLNVEPLKDNNFHTKNYLNLCKDFVQEIVAKDTNKKEQVEFLNRSIDYFNKKELFDYEEFKQEVIHDEEKEKKFDTYVKSYREDFATGGEDKFFISAPAVKQMKKKFKNIIKLDTQLEIRWTGAPEESGEDYLERGFDEGKGMHYYKIFFHEEK